ncbi:hypothetical protein E2C01_018625 [Portunus trituberculatus]|uniref:Uncharacterized protein n=1 Tax=Portunus trituberculatus TaxID=210409 RepID=A0A5B7DVQ6_PORTR|nr:hypothetical protein [Portunus trituberculatus]
MARDITTAVSTPRQTQRTGTEATPQRDSHNRDSIACFHYEDIEEGKLPVTTFLYCDLYLAVNTTKFLLQPVNHGRI